MKFVLEFFKLTCNCVSDRIRAVKLVNSFAIYNIGVNTIRRRPLLSILIDLSSFQYITYTVYHIGLPACFPEVSVADLLQYFLHAHTGVSHMGQASALLQCTSTVSGLNSSWFTNTLQHVLTVQPSQRKLTFLNLMKSLPGEQDDFDYAQRRKIC